MVQRVVGSSPIAHPRIHRFGFLCYLYLPFCYKQAIMNKESLKDLQVTPLDIDASYHPVHQNYSDYSSVMRHSRQATDNGLGDYARALGVNRTRDVRAYNRLSGQFRNWVKRGRIPYSSKSILALHELDIFPSSPVAQQQDGTSRLIYDEIMPFDHKNDLFPLVSLLSSYGFWRGCHYHQQSSGSSFDLNKSYVDDLMLRIIESLLSKEINPADTNQRVSLDAIHSRLLTILGSEVGAKGGTESAYPKQVEAAINSLNDSSSDDQERDIARGILRDFILTFFYVGKCRYTKSRKYSGVLPFSQDDEIATRRSELFQSAIESSRLDIATRVQRTSQMGGSGQKTPTYSRIIFFDGIDDFDISRMQSELHERALAMIKIIE